MFRTSHPVKFPPRNPTLLFVPMMVAKFRFPQAAGIDTDEKAWYHDPDKHQLLRGFSLAPSLSPNSSHTLPTIRSVVTASCPVIKLAGKGPEEMCEYCLKLSEYSKKLSQDSRKLSEDSQKYWIDRWIDSIGIICKLISQDFLLYLTKLKYILVRYFFSFPVSTLRPVWHQG